MLINIWANAFQGRFLHLPAYTGSFQEKYFNLLHFALLHWEFSLIQRVNLFEGCFWLAFQEPCHETAKGTQELCKLQDGLGLPLGLLFVGYLRHNAVECTG